MAMKASVSTPLYGYKTGRGYVEIGTITCDYEVKAYQETTPTTQGTKRWQYDIYYTVDYELYDISDSFAEGAQYNQNISGRLSGGAFAYPIFQCNFTNTITNGKVRAYEGNGGNDYPGIILATDSYKEITVSYGTNTTGYFQTRSVNVVNTGPIKVIPPEVQATILTADNFTDEDNPTIAYGNTTYFNSMNSIQACISLDGETPLIAYRDIPQGGAYTFNFTDAERAYLRANTQGATTHKVWFITKTVIANYTNYSKAERVLTIVGCNPTLNPTVVDIKEETLALTGSADTVVRYESMVEFAVNATASKEAEIISQSIQCGSKTVSDLPYGVIDDVESGTFIFKATDSRNLRVEKVIQKTFIEYVKPTCYQNLKVEVSGELGARVILTISGNYYNGSFGAVNNTLLLEMRYTNDNGVMGNWTTVSGTPTFNGTTYEIEVVIEGFTYSRAYTFQCRATDKLNLAQSSQYELKMYPVFDWGEEDFNFNVPVKMDGETVLRHNKTAKNTVLAASGGHIYLRPGGDEDTSGELKITPAGNVEFGGEITVNSTATFNSEVNLNGGVMIDGTDLNDLIQPQITPADYITASGTASMGSNGTWYWQKWNSGKAECWGKRNFGNMAITTSWGNLYRSAALTQDLPSGLFNDAPDVININMVSANFGGWICRHEQTAPSASSTGSFIYVRPASATATAPTNIGFHIIGTWK
jgi:hypothetical protein